MTLSPRALFRSLFRRPAAVRPTRRHRLALETLEDRTVPTIFQAGSTLFLVGTSGADQFRVQLASGNQNTLQVSDDNGSTSQNFSLTGTNAVTGVAVFGLGGNDNLTINLANGLINNGGSVSLPINFAGGSGQDTVTVTGSPSGVTLNEVYTLGASQNSGMLTFTNGTGSTPAVTLNFNTTEKITDTATASSLTVNGRPMRNLFNITNGTTVNGVTTDVIEAVSNPNHKVAILHQTGAGGDNDDNNRHTVLIWVDEHAVDSFLDRGDQLAPNQDMGVNQGMNFTTLAFANKAAVTINGGASSDLFNLNVTTTATGLTNLTLNGNGGFDVLLNPNPSISGLTVTPTSIEQTLTNANDIFLQLLFEQTLNRAVSDADLNFFRNLLNGQNGLLQVVQMIENSLESRALMVLQWFQQFLNRSATDNELQFFQNLLSNGTSDEDALAQLLSTPEFGNLANMLFGGTSGANNFTNALFLMLLNRSAGDNDLSFFSNDQQSEGQRGAGHRLVQSAEFRNRELNDLFEDLLDRSASSGDQQFFVNNFGLSVRDFRRLIKASQEFFRAASTGHTGGHHDDGDDDGPGGPGH